MLIPKYASNNAVVSRVLIRFLSVCMTLHHLSNVVTHVSTAQSHMSDWKVLVTEHAQRHQLLSARDALHRV